MDLLYKIKEHILVTLFIVMVGVLSLFIAMIEGYFGLAIQAFVGLSACATLLVFIVPVMLKKGDKS
jgi:predicted RND superfamily exporter protein